MSAEEIADLEKQLADAKARHYDETAPQYPKWVEPHKSQVMHKDDGSIITSGWRDVHISRDGRLTVLVADADEEAKAKADKSSVEETSPEESTESDITGEDD